MNLQTARLRIRDLTPADAERLFPIYANAEVRRFIGGQPTRTLAEQREHTGNDSVDLVVAVPEPSLASLLAIAPLGLLARRRRWG